MAIPPLLPSSATAPGGEICPEETDRRPRRPRRVSPLLLLHPGGAGDVEVHPRGIAGEFLEEAAGRDRPGLASADVLQLPDVALYLLEILLVQRQFPRLLPRRRRGRLHPGEHPLVAPHRPDLKTTRL